MIEWIPAPWSEGRYWTLKVNGMPIGRVFKNSADESEALCFKDGWLDNNASCLNGAARILLEREVK